jgi:hypothetical protein
MHSGATARRAVRRYALFGKEARMSQMSPRYQDDTGRQDVAAPAATVEKSDPTPVDEKRGQRMLLGISLVGVLFLIVIILAVIAFR